MEAGGRQCRGNRVRAAGFTMEASLKIEQALRDSVCAHPAQLGSPLHTGNFITLFSGQMTCAQILEHVLAQYVPACAPNCTC